MHGFRRAEHTVGPPPVGPGLCLVLEYKDVKDQGFSIGQKVCQKLPLPFQSVHTKQQSLVATIKNALSRCQMFPGGGG